MSRSGSVRSEQRSLGEKDLPLCGLRRIWPVASLLVGHSPTFGGCSLLAPQAKLGATNAIAFMFMTTQLQGRELQEAAFGAKSNRRHLPCCWLPFHLQQ